MKTNIRNELADAICEQWGISSEKTDICLVLLDYIVKNDPKHLTHLTYHSLHRIVGLGYLNSDLVKCVDYLSTIDEVKLFNTNLEYFAHEDDIPCLVEVDEETGDLIHSETGEVIKNMSNVFPYFTLTDKAKFLSNHI